LKLQASKMKNNSENRLHEEKIGETVEIRTPEVDKARSDLRCILGVIISDNFHNEFYFYHIKTII